MQIAKLMPQISFVERCFISRPKMIRTRQCLQHRQMCGVRFVHAGQETVYDPHRPIGRYHQVCPPLTRMDPPRFFGNGLERADHRGADSPGTR